MEANPHLTHLLHFPRFPFGPMDRLQIHVIGAQAQMINRDALVSGRITEQIVGHRLTNVLHKLLARWLCHRLLQLKL